MSIISVSYRPLSPLDISPVVFQNWIFWGLVSLLQVPRVEVPDMGHESSLLGEELRLYDIPANCGLPHIGGIFLETRGLADNISAFPPHLDVVLLFFVVEEMPSWFSGLFLRE